MSKTNAVAIIPARAGSKRIPKKNAKPFHGKPMIHYSIEIALESGLFDQVIVSTDSEEIAEVSRQAGAKTPFIRPASISDDFTPLADVVHHGLTWLRDNQGKSYEHACCILATAPFMESKYLNQGYELIRSTGASSIVPVTSFGYPIFRSLKITEQGVLTMFWPEHELTRSNDLPHAYHDVGQFYWLRSEPFLAQKRIFTPDARPLQIPRHLVQDIDTPEDWERAELMFKALKSGARA